MTVASITFDPIMAEESNRKITETHRKESRKLLDFIRKRIPEPSEAEDIVQDVFTELVEMFRLMKPIEQMSAWLFRVARNKITDRYRKKKTERLEDAISNKSAEDEEQLLLADIIPAETSDPGDKMLRDAAMNELALAIEELPEEQKLVFTLHEMEGKSFNEISELTGVSINTLLSRKRYAVLFLRERLRKLYEEILNN